MGEERYIRGLESTVLRKTCIIGFVGDSAKQGAGVTWTKMVCPLLLGDSGHRLQQGQGLYIRETKRLMKCWEGVCGGAASSGTEDGLRAG